MIKLTSCKAARALFFSPHGHRKLLLALSYYLRAITNSIAPLHIYIIDPLPTPFAFCVSGVCLANVLNASEIFLAAPSAAKPAVDLK